MPAVGQEYWIFFIADAAMAVTSAHDILIVLFYGTESLADRTEPSAASAKLTKARGTAALTRALED